MYEINKNKFMGALNYLLEEVVDYDDYHRIISFVKNVLDLEDEHELLKELPNTRNYDVEMHRIMAIVEFKFEVDGEVLSKHYEVYEKTSEVCSNDKKAIMELVNKEPRYWLNDVAERSLHGKYFRSIQPVENWHREYEETGIIPVRVELPDGRDWIEKVKADSWWHVEERPGGWYELTSGFWNDLDKVLMRKYVSCKLLKVTRQKKKPHTRGGYYFNSDWSEEEVLYEV